ncbi:MAG: glutathione S-transferase [Gammaproteobacteria bacterium]|nr:MAG: glutathione S-transferase [Gammaproteobacteria bacterium]
MPDIILHHFDASPFAEKIRLALGLKGLAWCSVQIPMIMPKPELTALTGGYRKTPVMQIGAEIFCDTRRIAVELERRWPEPSLFPAGSAGLALALANWSDRAFFEPGAGLSMGSNPEIPEPVLEDRKKFFNFMDFSRLSEELPHLAGQFRAQAALVERQLADGRDWLLGDSPGWVDILAYFPLWMARANVPGAADLLAPFSRLPAWEARVAGIGHGRPEALTAAAAIEIAANAEPAGEPAVDPDDPLGLAPLSPVEVAADDYGKEPVAGELWRLDTDEICIRRVDRRAGALLVHFPRAGYRVSPR